MVGEGPVDAPVEAALHRPVTANDWVWPRRERRTDMQNSIRRRLSLGSKAVVQEQLFGELVLSLARSVARAHFRTDARKGLRQEMG